MNSDDSGNQQNELQSRYQRLGSQKVSKFKTFVNNLTNAMVLTVFFSIIFIIFLYTISVKTESNFISLIHQPSNQTAQYDVVFLNATSALCLDGSPAAYEISKHGDPNKIYLHFQGGGWCQGKNSQETLQDCHKRSKTEKGSSRFYPQSNLTFYNQGVFSSQNRNNFKDWKKIKLFYCDGSGHQGTRNQPVKYKDSLLFFRGHNITVETLNDLQNKIGVFSKAKQIIVGGDSAGGLAAYQWANYIKNKVKNGLVRIVSDCGIFFDSYHMETLSPLIRIQYKSLMQIVNKEIDPPVNECIKKNPLQKQKCMFAQNIINEIKAPIFVIQALYDDWSVVNILGIKCIQGLSLNNCIKSEKFIIDQNRRNILKIVDQIKKNPKNGAWMPACSRHTYTTTSAYYNQNFRIPSESTNSASLAVQKWLNNQGNSHFHIDEERWPSNTKCSGINRFI